MEVRVQSKHLLDENLLVNIWRRSALPDECFSDFKRHPKTNLGVFSYDSIFFWANWLYTNKGLISVFDLSTASNLKEWRIIVILNDAEKSKSVVIKETESSVYVFQTDTGKLTRFRFVRKDKPQLLESQVDKIPEWLAKKIAEAKDDTITDRLNNLKTRLDQLKQRRET